MPILRLPAFGGASDVRANGIQMKDGLPTRVPAPLPLWLILHVYAFGRGADVRANGIQMKDGLPTRVPAAWVFNG